MAMAYISSLACGFLHTATSRWTASGTTCAAEIANAGAAHDHQLIRWTRVTHPDPHGGTLAGGIAQWTVRTAAVSPAWGSTPSGAAAGRSRPPSANKSGDIRGERRTCARPARTRPPEGPNFPSQERKLPDLASFLVKIATLRPQCAKLGKSRAAKPKLSSSVFACAQGRRIPTGCEYIRDPR